MDPLSEMPGFRPLAQPGTTAPPASPKRTASGSPSKRRRFSPYTEDNEGQMGIERYLYRSDYLRSTTAPIPYPLPLKIDPAPTSLANLTRQGSKLRAQIQQILHSHDIYDSGLQSKPGYPRQGSHEVAALHVFVDFPDSLSSHE